jgi:hypothetical protein
MLFLPRRAYLRPFLLSLIVGSSAAAKIVHLLQHIRTLPRSSFYLYLPTFFLLDFLVVVVAWALLQKTLGIGNVGGLLLVAFVAYGRLPLHFLQVIDRQTVCVVLLI